MKWTKVLTLDKWKKGYSAVVHRRPLEGDSKGINMIRIDIKYANTKKEWYKEMVKNGAPYDNAKERKIIKESPGEKIVYNRLKIGGFVSDREVLAKKTDVTLDDGSILYTMESVDMPEHKPANGCVRMEMFKTVLLK